MNFEELKQLIDEASNILVIQAGNPDGDSLSTSLALEALLEEQDKKVILYCPSQMPSHLRYISGWDRVSDTLESKFDLSIIVDTSSMLLLDKVLTTQQEPIIRSKPLIIIDHHASDNDIPFTSLYINDETSVSTGEIIYKMAKSLSWKLSKEVMELLTISIMYDSLGLISDGTSADSIRTIAEFVDNGVSLADLDAKRKRTLVRSQELTNYKGRLLQRIEFSLDGALATVDIPWEEIEKYSDQYNPSMLVLEDMKYTKGVKIAIAYKSYPDGKVTAKIRSTHGYPVSSALAEKFDGGGHNYAAGFKLKNTQLEDVKSQVVQAAKGILK